MHVVGPAQVCWPCFGAVHGLLCSCCLSRGIDTEQNLETTNNMADSVRAPATCWHQQRQSGDGGSGGGTSSGDSGGVGGTLQLVTAVASAGSSDLWQSSSAPAAREQREVAPVSAGACARGALPAWQQVAFAGRQGKS